MDFSKLKARSGKTDELARLTEEAEKLNKKSFTPRETDDRIWQPTRGKDGNGSALIRFLPAPGDEPVPFVRVHSYWFKGPSGKIYDELSLATLNQADPVNEEFFKLRNSELESEKEKAKRLSRNVNYYSNIYVIKDPGNPENEGKVFLYRYGKKIFDKINDLLNPGGDDADAIVEVEPVNVFDLWTGANFHIKVSTTQDGDRKYPNYDRSTFLKPGPLLDDDAALEAIWKQEHSLQAFVDPSKFKSYDALKERLAEVLGVPVSSLGKQDSSSDGKPLERTHKPEITAHPEVIGAPPDDDKELEDLLNNMNV